MTDKPTRAWLLSCGHKFEINKWQEILTDGGDLPERAKCAFCGSEQSVDHVASAPERGEYRLGDTVLVDEVDPGVWRWTRRGRFGELVDVSENFDYERDAILGAAARNHDAMDRR